MQTTDRRVLFVLRLRALQAKDVARLLDMSIERATGLLNRLAYHGLASKSRCWDFERARMSVKFTITREGVTHCQELLA